VHRFAEPLVASCVPAQWFLWRERPNHGYGMVQVLSEKSFRSSIAPDVANDSFAYMTDKITERFFLLLASSEFAF
jgi:hypothetical protein